MVDLLILIVFVTCPSMWLILAIERKAARLFGSRLPFYRRLLIPIPIVALLAANLSGVMSLGSYLQAHPETFPIRNPENLAWRSDGFAIGGLALVFVMPWLLTGSVRGGFEILCRVWIGHFLWLACPFWLLLLMTGVPLRD
jgi:hypothetical protein